MVSASDAEFETESARYQVETYASDGCTTCLLMRVTPLKPDEVLLMSNYGYDVTDPIPAPDGESTGVTFEQAAQSSGKRIVVSGFFADGMGKELTNSASYVEEFEEDGSMLLFGRWNFAQPTAEALTQSLVIQEYEPGDAKAREYPLDVELKPTVALETAVAKCDADLGVLKADAVRAYRSPLGMFMYVDCTITGELDDAAREELTLVCAKLSGSDGGEITLLGGGACVLSPDGQPRYTMDEAQPGDAMHFEMELVAGEAMPDSIEVTLYDYTGKYPAHTFGAELGA